VVNLLDIIPNNIYPIHHFYHIYCGFDYAGKEDSWKLPLENHLIALKQSGLNNYINTMHIGLVGNDNHRQHAKDFISQHEINFTVVAESINGFEQVTQDQLYNFAQTNNGYILYAHTKGSFNLNQQNIDWCKSMTYFNIIKWRDCVARLNQFDAVGCNWFDFSGQSPSHLGGPHVGQRWFAGTFWWSKLNRIRDIGRGPTHYTRWDAEVWIGQIPNIDSYNITGSETGYHNAVVTEW